MRKIIVLFFTLLWTSTVNANVPYRGYVDFALGDAYNINTAQIISTNNMQLYGMTTTTHGVVLKNWFLGLGIGYYRSFRDKENMYPVFVVGRYTVEKKAVNPYIEARSGIVYDPFWERKKQIYGTLGTGVSLHKNIQLGVRLSMFSRSRFFTANAAFAVSYSFGRL